MTGTTVTPISEVIHEKQLRRFKVALQRKISANLPLENEIVIDLVGEQIVAEITAFVWGEDVDYKVIVYPKDWLEAVKERFLPGWAKKWWPVKYTLHEINAKAIYPDFIPIQGHPPTFRVWESTYSQE